MTKISAIAIGKKYGSKARNTKRLRVMLTRLGIISKIPGTNSYNYVDGQLPETPKELVDRFSLHFWTSTIDDILIDVASTIEDLAEQMGEWRDNMGESEGLAQTEKYSMVEETADILENSAYEIQDISINDDSGIEVIIFCLIWKKPVGVKLWKTPLQ